MNLVNILYEPYVIIIFISLLITLISYFIVRYNKKDEENKNISKTLLLTFIISFVLLFVLKFGISYMNTNNFFQKGGVIDTNDRLTIIADDVDFDILE